MSSARQAAVSETKDAPAAKSGATPKGGQKSAIAGKLNLLEEEDADQPDFERFRRVFLRARGRGIVSDLDREVREAAARAP